jgi:hypothetical protein
MPMIVPNAQSPDTSANGLRIRQGLNEIGHIEGENVAIRIYLERIRIRPDRDALSAIFDMRRRGFIRRVRHARRNHLLTTPAKSRKSSRKCWSISTGD